MKSSLDKAYDFRAAFIFYAGEKAIPMVLHPLIQAISVRDECV